MARNGFSMVTPASRTTTAGRQNSSQPRYATNNSGQAPASAGSPPATTRPASPAAATNHANPANHLLVRALKIAAFPACGTVLMPPIIQYSRPQHESQMLRWHGWKENPNMSDYISPERPSPGALRPDSIEPGTGRRRGDGKGSVVLEVRDLSVDFGVEKKWVPAAVGLNYEVRAGEVLAIVGESGSGKSASSMAL